MVKNKKNWVDNILDLEKSMNIKKSKVAKPIAQYSERKKTITKNVPLLKKKQYCNKHYVWNTPIKKIKKKSKKIIK